MDLDISAPQQAILDRVTRFAREQVAPAARAIDEEGVFPLALVRAAFELGLAGVTIPKELGGGGGDYVAYALAVEAIARASATLAVIVAVQNSLVAEPIARFGTDAQKEPGFAGSRRAARSARSHSLKRTPAVMRRTSRRWHVPTAADSSSMAARCGWRTPRRRSSRLSSRPRSLALEAAA